MECDTDDDDDDDNDDDDSDDDDDDKDYINLNRIKIDGLIGEFDTMSSQHLRALSGTISAKVTYFSANYNCSLSSHASVLSLSVKRAGGSMHMTYNESGGYPAFKFNPGFFDISLEDARSLKFVSNILGLDNSAMVRDLQDYQQHPPSGYYELEQPKENGHRIEGVNEKDMQGNDPAWIMAGRVNNCE